MDHEQKIASLEGQIKQYMDMFNALNAEKTALDQMLIESLKSSLDSKKNVLMCQRSIEDLNNQIVVLKREKENLQTAKDNLQSEKDELQKSMTLLASEAQATEG